jgi:hypothetical protein
MSSQSYDPEEIERQLAVKLSMTALQGEGSVPAARQVLEVLDRIRSRQAAEEHRRRMAEVSNQPLELARYLGYIGEEPKGVQAMLGHAMTEDERSAYEEGRRRRQQDLRAVELDRAVRGQGKPAPWMRG